MLGVGGPESERGMRNYVDIIVFER